MNANIWCPSESHAHTYLFNINPKKKQEKLSYLQLNNIMSLFLSTEETANILKKNMMGFTTRL